MKDAPIHRVERHSWTEPNRSRFKTERYCRKCQLVKVTDHSDPTGATFTKWWHADIGDIPGDRTPQCPPRAEKTAA